jgi:hypothetical protein
MNTDALETLLPELRSSYVFDRAMVHHKLVIEHLDTAEDAARINRICLEKKAHLAELKSDIGDGYTYVFLHERPYRFKALASIAKRLSYSNYWELVRDVWIDSENIHRHYTAWKQIWAASIPQKERCMDATECAQLARMPLAFDVWRGVGFRGRVGLSWTLDRDKAVWFARRFESLAGKARIFHGKVKRHDVHAFFTGREEAEIVASEVKVLRLEKLPPVVRGSRHPS